MHELWIDGGDLYVKTDKTEIVIGHESFSPEQAGGITESDIQCFENLGDALFLAHELRGVKTRAEFYTVLDRYKVHKVFIRPKRGKVRPIEKREIFSFTERWSRALVRDKTNYFGRKKNRKGAA